MLPKYLKRVFIFSIALIVSIYIWHINRNVFYNPIDRCLILSTTTFLIIFVPFEIYFSFRELWYERWGNITSPDLKITKVKIPIDEEKNYGYIVADLITKRKITKGGINKNKIIILNHGFSDTRKDLNYLYFPLALRGYTLLSYDARGSGESKKLGRRNQLIKRIEDYKTIINWIKSHDKLTTYNIISIGISIGSIVVFAGSFLDERIKKIIAISSISRYKLNIKRLNPLILLSFLLRGISLFPKPNENKILSPYYLFRETKSRITSERWNKLSKRVCLIHCKNDRAIKFKNFQENVEVLDLPPENRVVFKKGGHTMKKNEIELIGNIIRFLED